MRSVYIFLLLALLCGCAHGGLVVETRLGTVVEVKNYRFLAQWGAPGSGDGQFDHPTLPR